MQLFSTSKKGQMSFTLALIVFTIIWLGGFAAVISEVGKAMVEANGLTGIVAWFFANLNLVIALFLIVTFIEIGRSSN